jgi:hypothetical protein
MRVLGSAGFLAVVAERAELAIGMAKGLFRA